MALVLLLINGYGSRSTPKLVYKSCFNHCVYRRPEISRTNALEIGLFAFLAFVSVGGVEGGNTGVVVLEKVNKIGGD